MKAALPDKEAERLEALRGYDILDSPPEQAFDDLTLLASHICETPIALVSLVDETRQWFKSTVGMSTAETSRDTAFCAHTILNKDEILEVCDAQSDPRFADNLLVTSDPRIRFYAGAPLVTPDGHALGALCVMDRAPRKLTAEQVASLRALSRHVVSQLECRRQANQLLDEGAERDRAVKLLRQQYAELVASKEKADGLLTLAQRSRRALLSVFEDHKRAGQNLHDSEERFRQLAEHVDEVFWIVDLTSGRILYVSPPYERIWGRRCTELYASPLSWLEAIHPDDREAVSHAFSTKPVAGTYDEEYRIIRPDGAVRWIRDRAFPVPTAAGHVNRVVGVATDITRRKRANDSLKESERRFREMLENVQLIAMTLDRNGSVIFCNDYLLQLTGWERDEVIGSDWCTKFIPESDPDVIKVFRTKIENGTIPAHHESPIKTKTGDIRETAWNNTMLRDTSGNIIGTASIGEDITERKRSEERVREQADIINRAHDAVVVREFQSDKITVWNEGAERLYGWSAAEAIGRSMGELVLANASNREHVLQRLVSTGEFGGEIKHHAKDGREVIVDARLTLIRDDDGTPRSVLGINTDITDRKKLETQLLRSQRLESIGTLASGMAHDLNNILTPILMCADILSGEELSEDLSYTVSLIGQSARRGASVVKQVLTFARGVEGERVTINPRHLIEEMVDIAHKTFPRSIEVSTKYSEDLWSVQADPTQLHQVLLNLSVNARDAMPDGGFLVFTAENVEIDEAYAAMTPDSTVGPHILLQVSDTGAGMPRDVIDKIFDPFFTTKAVGKGTGLGLSTVLGIAKSHGGFVSVESKLSCGTTFKIFLPATEVHAVSPAQETAKLRQGNEELILIVDDEEPIRRVAKCILEKNNYRVLEACDGPEAVVILAQHVDSISAIFTDLMLPFMDGVSLIRAARKMKPQLVCVATSAEGDMRLAELRSLNIANILAKPYDTGKLLQTLHEALAAVD